MNSITVHVELWIVGGLKWSAMSLMKILKKVGPRTLPWGTPQATTYIHGKDVVMPTRTDWILLWFKMSSVVYLNNLWPIVEWNRTFYARRCNIGCRLRSKYCNVWPTWSRQELPTHTNLNINLSISETLLIYCRFNKLICYSWIYSAACRTNIPKQCLWVVSPMLLSEFRIRNVPFWLLPFVRRTSRASLLVRFPWNHLHSTTRKQAEPKQTEGVIG